MTPKLPPSPMRQVLFITAGFERIHEASYAWKAAALPLLVEVEDIRRRSNELRAMAQAAIAATR